MIPRMFPSGKKLSKAQRQQIDDSFAQAKAKLDIRHGQGPFVLASKVSQSVFDAWDDDGKAAWGIAYDSAAESILMYGDTGCVHSGICGSFAQTVILKACAMDWELAGLPKEGSTYEQRVQAADTWGVSEALRPSGRTTMYTEQGAKSPDASYYACGFGSTSLVLEVAHRNEGFAVLKQEIAWWHAAGVGLALGIFVEPASDKSDPSLVLLSQRHHESKLTQKRFGRLSGCRTANLPEFQLKIPLRFLLDHPMQEVMDKSLLIDLYKLQQNIVRDMEVSQALPI